jgi:hypothetical protein
MATKAILNVGVVVTPHVQHNSAQIIQFVAKGPLQL